MLHLKLNGFAIVIGAIFHALTMLAIYIVGREEGSKRAAKTFLEEMREYVRVDAE